MLLATVIGLLALVIIAWVISRDLISPQVVFSGTWSLTLLAALMSGDLFYPISDYACLVYLVGASAFCIGALLCQFALRDGHAIAPVPIVAVDARRFVRIALDLLLITVVVGLPFYWRTVLNSLGGGESAGSVALGVLLQSIRRASVEVGDQGASIGPLANVVVLSQFVAAAMFYERDGTWQRAWRASVAIILSLVLGGMTGAKGNAVNLILTLFFLAWLMHGKPRVRWVLTALVLAIALFSVGLMLVNFGGGSIGEDRSAMSSVLIETLLNYWIGSPIAFGPVAENPNLMQSSQHVGRFFLETARSLGWNVDVPSLHAQYTMISATADTNTYTIYFSYFKDFGWAGTIVSMAALAFALTMLYSRARRGGAVATQFYAMMCVGLVLSFTTEHFMLELNRYIKALLFFGFLYAFLPSLERTTAAFRQRHA